MKKPRYYEVYSSLQSRIVHGAYAYGSYLPSKRVCAREFEVSLITVEHALQLLDEEGYIEGVQRKGYRVIYQDRDFFSVGQEDEIAAKGTQTNDARFPYSTYAKAIRKIVTDNPARLLEREEATGCLALRQAIASYLSRSRDMLVHPDQIVICAGAEYMYSLLPQLLGKDLVYAVENPSYEKIAQIYEAEGVTVERLRMGQHGIYSKALQEANANVLHVTPVNSYPSGVSADASKRREYIEWAKKRNAIVIEDDYASEYSTMRKTEETLFSLECTQHVIYLNSFTRTIGPGVRIGYMIFPQLTYPKYIEKLQNRACTVSTLDQLVVAELLNNGAFERNLNRIKRNLRRKNEKKEM